MWVEKFCYLVKVVEDFIELNSAFITASNAIGNEKARCPHGIIGKEWNWGERFYFLSFSYLF